MSGTQFSWQREKQAGASVFLLKGLLDEGAQLDELAKEIRKACTLDVRGITTITSMGIRGWLAFVGVIAPYGPHRVRGCPPFFVTQINMIPNFTGSAIIESILLPYYCTACHLERLEPFNLEGVSGQVQLPTVECRNCARPMMFDELESRYFAFLTDPDLLHPRPPALSLHSEPVSTNPDGSPQTVILNNVDEVLRNACQQTAPATVSLSDVARVLSGSFYALEDGQLLVALHGLSGLPSPDDIRLGQHAVVTFYYETRPVFFLTTITDRVWPSQENRRPLLELELPRQIAAAEVRRALRVPIPPNSGVEIELNTDGHQVLVPRLCNLSISGMLVEFDIEADPQFVDLDRCEAIIIFGSHKVHLRAVVRRRDCGELTVRYGLNFPEISAHGIVGIPAPLRSIVDHFEEAWLRRLTVAEGGLKGL